MDTFFNQGFADRMRTFVSKMDDDSAEMFVRFATYDIYQQDYANNRRSIESRAQRINKELAQEISKSLISRGDQQSLEVAKLVSTIAKDRTPFEEAYGTKQPRDEGGQWTVTFSHGKFRTPVKAKQPLPAGYPGFNVTGALVEAAEAANRFQEKWSAAGRDDIDARTWQRLAAGGRLLGYAPNESVRAAGHFAEFTGSFGPEAEKVVGPHLRRLAYRYRGIERKIDPKLTAYTFQAETEARRRADLKPGEESTPEIRRQAAIRGALAYLGGNRWGLKEPIVGEPDRTDFGRIPTKQLARLQAQSGRIPPSEGVMINADGKIIAQAVGFADDHYLPFNLRNLKGLQEGSYVRTRSSGGLTTEDIYTGLVAGARSVTVTSRSGIFTITFAPDFRGARRYNDKAAAMVDRYAKILDAIKSEQVEVTGRGPTDEDKADLWDRVVTEQGGPDQADPQFVTEEYNRRLKDLRASTALTARELKQIEEAAVQETGGRDKEGRPAGAKFRSVYAHLRDQAMEKKKTNRYRLDGEGYEAAQLALKEQFPYYIENTQAITYTHPSDITAKFKQEPDVGYVKPRYIRPEGALEGYYDPSITGVGSHIAGGKQTGKRPASETMYQNWAIRGPIQAKAVAAAAGQTAKVPEQPVSAGQRLRSAIPMGMARADAQRALSNAIDKIADMAPESSTELIRAASDVRAGRKLDLEHEDLLVEQLEQTIRLAQGNDKYRTTARAAEVEMRKYHDAIALLGQSAFSQQDYRAAAGQVFKQPLSFPDLPKAGESMARYAAARAQLLPHARLASLGLNADASDEQLSRAAAAYATLATAASGASDDTTATVSAMAQAGVEPRNYQHWLVTLLNPDTAARKALAEQSWKASEAIEKLRRLKILQNTASDKPKPIGPERQITEQTTKPTIGGLNWTNPNKEEEETNVQSIQQLLRPKEPQLVVPEPALHDAAAYIRPRAMDAEMQNNRTEADTWNTIADAIEEEDISKLQGALVKLNTYVRREVLRDIRRDHRWENRKEELRDLE